MTMMMRVFAFAAALAVPGGAGPAAAQNFAVAPERFFAIEWEHEVRAERPVVSGYVKNQYGQPALNLRVMVEGLDENTRVVSTTITWVGDITPDTAAYFEARPAAASAYRVSVFSYDWLEAPGGGDPR